MSNLIEEFCEIIKQVKAEHPTLRITQIINFASMDREMYYWTDDEMVRNMRRYARDLMSEKELEESESLGES